MCEGASVEEVEDSHPAKFQVKLASGRLPTARTPKCALCVNYCPSASCGHDQISSSAKHCEPRLGSHAQEVEETEPAKFQTEPSSGRFPTAHTPDRVLWVVSHCPRLRCGYEEISATAQRRGMRLGLQAQEVEET